MVRALALALFGAVAFGAETLQFGYGLGNGDLKFDFSSGSKTGGRSFSLTVAPWMYANQGQGGAWTYFLSIRLYTSAADCLPCVDPTSANLVNVYYKANAQTASTSDIRILNDTKGSDLATGGGVWVDIPITMGSTPTTYAFYISFACPGCSTSSELSRLEAIVRMKDLAATTPEWVMGGFDRSADRNTDWFSHYAGTFGPIMRIVDLKADDVAYVLGEISDTSLGQAGVVYYFNTNMSAIYASIANFDGAVLTCSTGSATGCTAPIAAFPGTTAGFRRVPVGTYEKGEFAVTASQPFGTAGTWYASGFVIRRASTRVLTDFRFAVGINVVPAPAAVSAPQLFSIVLALCIAAFSMH